MRTVAAMKNLELNNVERTFILTFPKEPRRRIYLAEYVCLQLCKCGFETEGRENFVFGRFPTQIKIRSDGEISEEMEASLKDSLMKLNIKVERSGGVE
jgi:hypothetical protein